MGNDLTPLGLYDLDARERLFVTEFLVDMDAAAAGIRAGYIHAYAGAALVARPHVAQEIERRLALQERAAVVKREDIVRAHAMVGFANMADLMTVNIDGDAVLDLSQATREQLFAVRKLTQETYQEGRGAAARQVKRTTVELYNRIESLTQLVKLLGYDRPQRVDLTVTQTDVGNVTPEAAVAAYRVMMDGDAE